MSSKVYFKGLHGLRFICAILVVIYHCNDALTQIDNSLRSDYYFLQKGKKAVDYFFILSGFLITYLALNEIHSEGKLNLKKFFIKRATRILPLYYLAIGLGILIFGYLYPKIQGSLILDFSLQEGLIKYMFFLPNLMSSEYVDVGPLRSLWSIGVEEQFYLFFPILILGYNQSSTSVNRISLALIVSLVIYSTVYYKVIPTDMVIYKLIIKYTRFHFILIGCLAGSCLFKYDKPITSLLRRQPLFNSTALILFALLIFSPNELDSHNLIGGLLFTALILSMATDNSMINLDNKYLTYLGTISYGIYIYHPYVSICLRFLMEQVKLIKTVMALHSSIFHMVVIILTVIIAGFSYKYFESYFIRLRK